MGSAMLLLSSILAGLIASSYQQVNSAPYFVTEENGQNVDGNLLDRLTKQGILENTAIGTSVGTLSCKDDDGDPIVGYGVQSQTLEVNEATGEVTVNRLLDRENYLKEFENNPTGENARLLKPVFSCWDGRGLTATVEIDITLTDVNDQAPEFLNGPYSKKVNENVATGSIIFTGISIRDEDAADNARVTVACSSSDAESQATCEIFTVVTTLTGPGTYSSSIVLQRQLDFESRRSYTMTLKAVDLGTPALTTSVNVLINVIDAQDTLPEFVNVPLTIYVRENVPLNTSVQLKIGARDGDQGSSRPVKIKIKNDTLGLFRLGPSLPDPDDSSIYRAAVIVNAPIDRETLLGTYRFEVEAVELDNGTETNARQDSFVQVDVLDENDNIPSFSQSVYNVTLAEIDSNAQSNFQIPDLDIQVTDRDDPSNAKYTVVIVNQSRNTFKIFPENEVSGNVAVNLLVIDAQLLDYDTPSLRFQRVVLEARESDANPKTSTATVNIFLQDLNDNSPQFTSSPYNYSLPENAPVGQSIATIQAIDRDEGENGNVTYTLRGTGNDQFLMDPTTGSLILSKRLDYEKQRVFQILVNAKDGGNPARETSTTLTIRVGNVNDEAPIPERAVYQTYAQETSLILRPAVVVKARDNEDTSGVITYRIIAGNTRNNAFRVDANTGNLTLASYIDYDETPSNGRFEVVIQASDNGNPPQYVNMTVRVDVQDENNNSPTFMMGSYSANISENAQPGTSVVNVIATDADSRKNGEFRYTIQSGGREHFDISNSSGLITVSSKADFDFNAFPIYNMVVFAIDSGSPPRTGSTIVIVNLLDANNKAPKFPQQFYVTSISEATPIGSIVLDMTATDEDSNSELRFSIPKSTMQARNSGGNTIPEQLFDYKSAFAIDPISGRIRTNSTLRRDLAAEITFNILVRDLNAEGTLRQTASTSVLVTILGTNISTIFFTPARYYFSVTEGKQIGYVITTVAARDPACGNCLLNNYVEVENSDPNNYLKVDQRTGQVSLTKALDYDDGDRRLNIDIIARANDGRTARTSVTVEVRDDNDNSPQFVLPSYDFSVSESVRYPFRVGYVKAIDKDSGSFGLVVYSLSGQGAEDFEIYHTGLILVSRSANLDFETTRVYNLLITASDNPTNQSSTVRKQTSVTLTITVLDVNDNVPKFSAIYPFYVVENYNIGQSVGRIIATDGDIGINGDIVYSMNDPRNLFRITNTGYILTQSSLRNQSAFSPFNVTVRAEDRGSPSLFNETQVIINVRSGQLDDGRPQWSIPRLGDPYYIDEGTPAEQLVLVAQAAARSVGPEVFYSLNSASPDYEKFKINSTTGRLTTNGVFDREDKAIIQIILVATDKANTTLQSFRALTIYVRDKDDNVPEFGKCPGLSLEVPQRVTISEDAPVGTSVYRVQACDLDEIINGVTYELETSIALCQTQSTGSFTVDSEGVIFTAKSLDRESKATHLVCVRAKVAQKRKRRQADVYPVNLMTDTSHVAYVVISLSDVNDNSAVFQQKLLYEVVPSVPTERTVVRVEATDPDSNLYNRVRYSITGIVYSEPGYPSYPLPGSFIVSPDTGIVSTNYPSYSDFRLPGSFFEVMLQAEDVNKPILKDTMKLYIYIFESAQTIRVVINEPPNDARNKVDDLLIALNGVSSDNYFKVQQISYHRGVTDTQSTKTDVCFVMVSKDNVQSVREGANGLDNSNYKEILQNYGAGSPGSCYKTRSSLDKISWQPLWWTLVALAIFIFICCCILIGAICILYKNHKDFMDSQETRMDPM